MECYSDRVTTVGPVEGAGRARRVQTGRAQMTQAVKVTIVALVLAAIVLAPETAWAQLATLDTGLGSINAQAEGITKGNLRLGVIAASALGSVGAMSMGYPPKAAAVGGGLGIGAGGFMGEAYDIGREVQGFFG